MAIGAPLNDGNGSNSGHTRLYEWDGTSWVQLGADIDGEAAGDQSGYSVSLSADGSRVAIGAIAMMAMEVIRVTRGCMNGMARAGFSWALTSMEKRQVIDLAGVYRCRQTAVAWR